MNTELLLHVSAIIYTHLQGASVNTKDIQHTASSNCKWEHTMPVYEYKAGV
jgi:hypothetical protein